MTQNRINGWLLVDKPLGITSYNVINQLKKAFHPSKIGHGGTLDPLASGVLAVAFGEATKTTNYVMQKPKEYEFTIKFGSSTSTYDLEGDITETSPNTPSLLEIQNILPKFTGEIWETPPNFSAIKINGTRAYKLARANKDFTIAARKVIIHSLQLVDFNEQERTAKFKAKVGKGVYIRSLGHNIAKAINSVAHVIELRRTEVGGLKEKPLLNLQQLYNTDRLLQDYMLTIEEVLDDIPAINLTKVEAISIIQGKAINLNLNCYDEQYCCFKALYNGKIISLLEKREDKIKILRNFNQDNLIDS
ncbi:tRNA pseudouridine(55) synthase TruB [Rickettsiales bacterium LUAb2]